VKAVEAFVFSTSFGDASTCEIASIKRWLDQELIDPEYK
jgi:hypothetical protein